MAKDDAALAAFLAVASIEITARDRASREAVLAGLPAGSEVFVANLPDQPPEEMREAVADIRAAGLTPVPHLVARNLAGPAALDALLGALGQAGDVGAAFVTGGDREAPLGPFASALDLVESGLLERHGIDRLAFACYPEGHPRLPADLLAQSLGRKLEAAAVRGFGMVLISQFAFSAAPVLALARALRAQGINAPLRVGTAGPAERGTLMQFAADLGAGPSAQRLATAGGEEATLQAFLRPLAEARVASPALGLEGVHLFPFGSTRACLDWLRRHRPHEGQAAPVSIQARVRAPNSS